MRVSHANGVEAFAGTAEGFLAAVAALDDAALLAASRCHGWALVDVVVHVTQGLQEVAAALLLPGSPDRPDVDAASYWRTVPPAGGEQQVLGILQTRRLASAYRAPTLAVVPLRAVLTGLVAAARSRTEGRVAFQGHVLETGDLWATWAVELAVHQLDLARETAVAPPAVAGLALARATAEALLGAPLPGSGTEAVLLATGRRPADPAEAAALGPAVSRLPVL